MFKKKRGNADIEIKNKIEENSKLFSQTNLLASLVFILMMLGNNAFNKPILAVACLLSLFFARTQIGSAVQLAMKSISLMAFWALTIASYSWSVVPHVSLDIIFVQSSLIALAILFITNNKLESFSDQLRLASIFIVFLVVAYCIAFPSRSYSSAGLNSFYPHKNSFGAFMGVIGLILMFAPNKAKLHFIIGLLAIFLLLASKSKTAIILFAICAISGFLFTKVARLLHPIDGRYTIKNVVLDFLYVSFLIMLVLLVIFRENAIDFLWNTLPKDFLTGRGSLWLVVIQQISDHTLLGFGPGTFWQAGRASEIAQTTLYQQNPFWVQSLGSADGSYIDLLASFGTVGLSLFMLTVVDIYRKMLKGWQQPDCVLLFVLTTFVIFQAFTETTIFNSTNLLWFLYLLCYLRVASFSKPRERIAKGGTTISPV